MKTLLPLAALLALLIAGCGGGTDGAALEEARETFLKGNEAFALSLDFERQAEAGDPEALKVAHLRAEDAVAYWQAAAKTRLDWPEARRNLERALIRLEQLRERKKEGTKRKKAPKKKDEPKKKDDEEKAPPRKVETKDLPAARVLGLLQLLEKREQLKRLARQKERSKRSVNVERDW